MYLTDKTEKTRYVVVKKKRTRVLKQYFYIRYDGVKFEIQYKKIINFQVHK